MAASSCKSIREDENPFYSVIVQFFEMVPLRRMKWQNESITSAELDLDTQKQVLSKTIKSDMCRRYPPALSYQKAFMKKLLHTLEHYDAEICEEIYELYSELLQQDEKEEDALCYKTYTLGVDNTITLQESVNMISNGTTGLSTWQAAQHLAEWSMENKQLFADRHVLELGSGLGLTGIAVCKQCTVKSYTFTDSHSQVLYLLARNILINSNKQSTHEQMCSTCDKTDELDDDSNIFRQIKRRLSAKSDKLETCDSSCSEEVDGYSGDKVLNDLSTQLELSPTHWEHLSDCGMTVCRVRPEMRLARLDWEEVDDRLATVLQATDIILAADVVYDKSIIPALVSTLRGFLCVPADRRTDRQSLPCAYLASTIRNEDTRDQFLISMSSAGLQYEQMEGPTQTIFHYDRSVPIEILKITCP